MTASGAAKNSTVTTGNRGFLQDPAGRVEKFSCSGAANMLSRWDRESLADIVESYLSQSVLKCLRKIMRDYAAQAAAYN